MYIKNTVSVKGDYWILEGHYYYKCEPNSAFHPTININLLLKTQDYIKRKPKPHTNPFLNKIQQIYRKWQD